MQTFSLLPWVKSLKLTDSMRKPEMEAMFMYLQQRKVYPTDDYGQHAILFLSVIFVFKYIEFCYARILIVNFKRKTDYNPLRQANIFDSTPSKENVFCDLCEIHIQNKLNQLAACYKPIKCQIIHYMIIRMALTCTVVYADIDEIKLARDKRFLIM